MTCYQSLIVTDVALVKNNAQVGSAIAVKLSAEMKKHRQNIEPDVSSTGRSEPNTEQMTDEDGHQTTRSTGNIVSEATELN